MNTAREDVLGRVRSALRQRPSAAATSAASGMSAAPATELPDVRQGVSSDDGPELVELFIERVEDYRAVVLRCGPSEVARAVREALGQSRRVVVPAGFPPEWLGELGGLEIVSDDPALSAPDLDAVDAVVTTARLGIAVTGTIVLDHGTGQGRRALSLVPDWHVCVVTHDQVVMDVPDGVRGVEPQRPLTWISGPSATSDIELSRVEGVHGPRNLYVVVVGAPPQP